jgi:serine O-acetyltransferase
MILTEDFRFALERQQKIDPGSSTLTVWVRSFPHLLLMRQYQAVALHRAAHWASAHRLRPLALLFMARSIKISGTEISPAATFGPGLVLWHTVGVTVGPEVIAGARCELHQGVTLGARRDVIVGGNPQLGDGVRIGAGAVILGPIKIGDGARVGANSTVLKDVPPDVTVTGLWK